MRGGPPTVPRGLALCGHVGGTLLHASGWSQAQSRLTESQKSVSDAMPPCENTVNEWVAGWVGLWITPRPVAAAMRHCPPCLQPEAPALS